MLEYDDISFSCFKLTMMLFLYAIPGTSYLLKEVYDVFVSVPAAESKTSTAEISKSVQQKKIYYSYPRIGNLTFRINTILVILCWLNIFYLYGQIRTVEPFRILNIEPGASMSQIKNAYRALSLMYHPDKNPGDTEKAEMFMKVTEAYIALTDLFPKRWCCFSCLNST